MKIAFYTPTLNLGGYEKVVVNYANAFSVEHEITVLCGKAEGALKAEIAPAVSVVDFKVRARGLLPALSRWLRYNTVDILYVPFTIYTCIAVFAKKYARSNTVIYGCQHGVERSKIKLVDWLFGRIAKKADVLAAVSATVADYDAKRLHISRKRYYVLDNPVFESTQKTLETCPKADPPSFVTAGRLAKDKHLEIPIRIVAELLKKTPVRLIILGNGPERDKLEELVRQLGIESVVSFEGFVEDTTEHICKCTALFQTSEVESFGNSVVEALRCGVPVITTDCGGPVEIIERDQYGINIGRYNDENVVAEGVDAALRILQEPFDVSRMQRKAQRYNALNLMEQFLRPYYECIK